MDSLKITHQCTVEVVELGLRATETLHAYIAWFDTSHGHNPIPRSPGHIRETGVGWEAFESFRSTELHCLNLYDTHSSALFSANLRDSLGDTESDQKRQQHGKDYSRVGIGPL